MSLEKLKKMDKVKNKDDYWNKLKIFKKAIGGIITNIKRFGSDAKKGIDHYHQVLDEGVRIGLITEEYRKEKLKQVADEMNKPSEFKEAVKKKINSAKNSSKSVLGSIKNKFIKNNKKDGKQDNKK